MEYASGLIRLSGVPNAELTSGAALASRLDEAAATLKDEEVHVESWFTVDIDGTKYLLWYLRAKSIKRVFEVSQRLKHPIDKFHYDVMAEITAANVLAVPLIDIPRG